MFSLEVGCDVARIINMRDADIHKVIHARD